MMKPLFFESRSKFRQWLQKNHKKEGVLWVGYFKKASGKPSITWPESIDQALCFGWIDGVRRKWNESSYVVRFTPRRAKSIWSKVNIERVTALSKLGLMCPAGFAAFESRDLKRSGLHSSKNPLELSALYLRKFKTNRMAWAFFAAKSAGYRRVAARWVMSAKREETQKRRLAALISDSEDGRVIGPLVRPSVKKK